MGELAVVVVAYQSAETLPSCLDGILSDPAATVVVVDNSSDPATAAACRGRVDSGRITYLDPGRNLGYASAANLGLRSAARSAAIAVVNPDVRLTRRLSELHTAAGGHTDDVLAGRLLSPAHPTSVNARRATTFRRELAKAVVGTRAYREPQLARPDGAAHDVAQLDGALLVMSGELWATLRGFDEAFELYYEDVDICTRVRHNGGRCLLLNQVWGEHIGGHSYARSGGAAYCALRISRVRFARRWWRPRWLAAAGVLAVTLTEFFVRSATRRAEGQSVRNRALALVIRELRQPHSQRVLLQPPPSEDRE